MVNILLATYNGSDYVDELLYSIHGQSYTDWHLTISDDNSSDDTPDRIQDFARKHPGKVTILEKEKPCGSAKANFMYLLAHSEGDYFMFCDQDDVWMYDKIEQTLAEMQRIEGDSGLPVLVHTDLCVVDQYLKTIAPSMFKYQRLADVRTINQLLVQNCVTGCTMMINKALKALAVKAVELDRIVMHDYWIALCAAVYGKISFIPAATILYRQHGDNSVGAKGAYDTVHLKRRLDAGKAGYHEMLLSQMEQAEYFLELMDLSEIPSDIRMTIKSFAELKTKSASERRYFYRKYHANKIGALRIIMQYLWG